MVTGVSTYGQALSLIDRLKEQQGSLDLLATQLSTGKKTQKFSGLGSDILTSKRARVELNSLDQYVDNIKNAERRIELMNLSISEFRRQAHNFYGMLIGFSQESTHQDGEIIYYDDPLTPTIVDETAVGMTEAGRDVDADTLRDFADKIYDLAIDLLNVQDGDRYLFGGSESSVKPIEDTGLLDATITTAIFNWKDEGGAGQITTQQLIADLTDRSATAANPDAVTDTIIGYNAQLSAGTAGDVFVRTEDNSEIEYTALANENPFRDIITAMSFFKNDTLWPMADVYAEPYNAGDPVLNDPVTGQPLRGAPGADVQEMKDNFYQVFNAMISFIHGALDDLDQVGARLANAQAQITQIRESHEDQQFVLENVVSDVEDADMNEVAVSINTLQLRLDASYRVTARIQELSLVNFI